MEKGVEPFISFDYVKSIGVNKQMIKKIPSHIRNGIKRVKRYYIEKKGLKKVLENEEFVRIRYVRYADNFLIGVRGSLEVAKKIKTLITNYMKGTLHLMLNKEKTKITNTYSGQVKFLGLLIYNKYLKDLPYKNSRTIENAKRVAKKNQIIKAKITNKILKNTRQRMILALNNKTHREVILDLGKVVVTKVQNVRATFRAMEQTLNTRFLDNKINTKSKKNKVTKTISKQRHINNRVIIRSIHATLKKYQAISTDFLKRYSEFSASIDKIIGGARITYCPKIISLGKEDLGKLILNNRSNTMNRFDLARNWTIVLRKLLNEQKNHTTEKGSSEALILNSNVYVNRTQFLNYDIYNKRKPILVIDKTMVYEKLKFAKIINEKLNPCCKTNIVYTCDFNIILYFNRVAYGLLYYFKCADDFFKMKNLVN